MHTTIHDREVTDGMKESQSERGLVSWPDVWDALLQVGQAERSADRQPLQAGRGTDAAAVLSGCWRDGELAAGEAADRYGRVLQGPQQHPGQ